MELNQLQQLLALLGDDKNFGLMLSKIILFLTVLITEPTEIQNIKITRSKSNEILIFNYSIVQNQSFQYAQQQNFKLLN